MAVFNQAGNPRSGAAPQRRTFAVAFKLWDTTPVVAEAETSSRLQRAATSTNMQQQAAATHGRQQATGNVQQEHTSNLWQHAIGNKDQAADKSRHLKAATGNRQL